MRHRARAAGGRPRRAGDTLDGGRGVVGGERQLALIDEAAVGPLPARLEDAVRGGQAAGQEQHDQEDPLHAGMVPEAFRDGELSAAGGF